jgi:hypothetical protein
MLRLFSYTGLMVSGVLLVWTCCLPFQNVKAHQQAASPESTKSDAAAAETSGIASESLLPAEAFFAFQADGHERHQPAISETARWKSIVGSELQSRLFDLLQLFVSTASPELSQQVRTAIEHLQQHGISAAASLAADGAGLTPYVVLVINRGEAIAPLIQTAASKIAEESDLHVQQSDVRGRQMFRVETNVPGVEVCWWTEGGHLVVTGGMFASRQILDTVDGTAKNITTSEQWTQLRSADDYTVTHFGWLDAEMLLSRFADLPIPDATPTGPLTIREGLSLLGLENLKRITVQHGFHNTETWTHGSIHAEGELTGLLGLLRQEGLTLEELPPLPSNVSGFAATRFDAGRAMDEALLIAQKIAQLAGPDNSAQVQLFQDQLQEAWGGDLKDDLTTALGDVWCLYGDTASLPIPVGTAPALAISIGDRERLMKVINRLVTLAKEEAENDQLSIRQSKKDGNDYVSVGFPGVPIFPTVLVTENWLVLGITPGTAQSFALREKGKAPSWKPDARVKEALAELPDEYSSITVSDPVPGYQQLLSFAPLALNMIESQVLPTLGDMPPEMPFGVEDLPAMDLITGPMFPNVSVGGITDHGWESWSRESVPSNPLGSLGMTAAAPVMVALLLPAVEQARTAARKTESRNNMKLLGLALHNYHETYGHFPRGTIDNPKLKPDQRVGWVFPILPYLEQDAVYQAFQPVEKEAWDSQSLAGAREIQIPYVQNPTMKRTDAAPSSMDYVGISGIGPDSANLPNYDAKAGIFGNNRMTKIVDIEDGTSNTLMIGEASVPNKSWLAGGNEAIRGFSRKPYLNGPDRIGSPQQKVVQFLMADGSVHSIAVDVDDTVLEALATKSGGEIVGDF